MELCEELAISGITPSMALLKAVLSEVSIPVHVLIRPRGGDFVYSKSELKLMGEQIEQVKVAGQRLSRLACCLPADGRVDVERTRELFELARPMKVTFHRAFDETNSLEAALEDVIRTGADCLLTSGGVYCRWLVPSRIGRLAAYVAGARLEVMAGERFAVDESRRSSAAQRRDLPAWLAGSSWCWRRTAATLGDRGGPARGDPAAPTGMPGTCALKTTARDAFPRAFTRQTDSAWHYSRLSSLLKGKSARAVAGCSGLGCKLPFLNGLRFG